MSEEPIVPTPEPIRPPEPAASSGWPEDPAPQEAQSAESAGNTTDSWKEVGRQFQSLGETLAAAFQASLKNESTRQHLDEMKTGLESMVQDVGQAIKSTASSQPVQQAKTEVSKATETLVARGEQAVQDARPHILNALRVVNAELQKLIDRMQSGAQPRPPAQPTTPPTRIEIEPSEDEGNTGDPSI